MPTHRLFLLAALSFLLVAAPAVEAEAQTTKPKVKLLSAGKGAKKVLRYDLKKGARETMVMVMDMQMSGAMLGNMTLPATQMTMDVKVTAVRGGKATYAFEITSAKAVSRPGVDQNIIAMMDQQLAGMVGTKGTAVVDRRGFTSDMKLEFPAAMPAMMKQQMQSQMSGMDQVSSPLPAEPVGAGARWEVHQTLDQNGIKVTQVARFELLQRKGKRGKMKATVTQKAPPQTINTGAGSAKLLDLSSKGGGTVHFDLAKLVPNSTMNLVLDQKLEAGGTTMDMKMTMGVEIKRK